MEQVIALLTEYGRLFLNAIWTVTDPIGVAFAIVGTWMLRSFVIGEEPEEAKDRTFFQKHLPLIPVVLGTAWVLGTGTYVRGMDWRLLVNRAVGTGTFALFAHKYFYHWWRGK